MPGGSSISETAGQPQLATDSDFSMCFIGPSTTNPVTAGQLTPAYSSPAAAVADLGLGDMVDALCQAIKVTPGNPAPPPASAYVTPATTPGARGGTLTVSGVTGTSVVTKTASTHPAGTYEPKVRVPVGGTVGTGPITLQASLDNGRTWLPSVTITTATTWKVQLLVNGVLVDTGVQYDLAAGNLNSGDTWSESKTTPPIWGDSDLYTAGPPATGAFAAIAESSQLFGMLIITEPVVTGDFATLSAGLDYGLSKNKRWLLTVRFRDPNSGETDTQYITAFQTFVNANHDSRIECVAGSGWLTDAFRAFVYNRSGLPALLARKQSFKAVPGQEGERLAQNPGWVARGPLEGFTLKDTNGNTIGHDEAIRAGIAATPGAPSGGGQAFYFLQDARLAGTYADNRGTVMYAPTNTVLTPMDRRVANAIEQIAVSLSLESIGGADIYDQVTFALDDDIRDGLASKIVQAIKANYAREFQNAEDPNLVVIDATVTVSGQLVTITGTLNVRFYGYTDTVALKFSATR